MPRCTSLSPLTRTPTNRAMALLATLGALIAMATPAPGQCTEAHWLAGNGNAGVSGIVNETAAWDPDGPGPRPPYVVIGGDFNVTIGSTVAGSGSNVSGLAAWNGGQFIALVGTGVEPANSWSGTVYALTTLANGDLVAAGTITSAGGVSVTNIARWNGTNWFPLGSGLNGQVKALAVMANGDLVAAGSFTISGATVVGPIARWNGTTWSAFAAGSPSNVVTMLGLPNGHLIIGGTFVAPATNIARWNGSAWSGFPAGVFTVGALALVPGTSDQFIVGGEFSNIAPSPLNNVARWTGSAWAGLGNGLGGGVVSALAVRTNGDVVVGGQFATARAFGPNPIITANNIATWNGAAWTSHQAEGAVNGPVRALAALPSGNVAVGGEFDLAGGIAPLRIAQWDGTRWSAYGQGGGGLLAMIELPGGGGNVVMACGATAGGVTVNNIGRWDGTRWNPLGTGFNNSVNAIVRLNNGDLVAGGFFTMSGATPTRRIARWNGAVWDDMGGGSLTNGTAINGLAVRPTGELVAVGTFTSISGVAASGVARWNSITGWATLGPGAGSSSNAVLALPNGDVIVGGGFGVIGGISAGNIARWSELTGWSAFISGTMNGPGGTVYGLARASNGDILAAGDFTQLAPVTRRARVARWNGSTWTLLGNDTIGGVALGYAIVERPDGTIVVGGNFTTMTGVSANNIAAWNGLAWSPLEGGLSSHVRSLLNHSSGELWAGGAFSFANRHPAQNWARWACADVSCATDLDDGTGTGTSDGAVTIDDLLYFLLKFEDGDASVDLDNGSGTGTPDGAVTIDDLLYFLFRFEEGC